MPGTPYFPPKVAIAQVVRSIARCGVLLASARLHQPARHVGGVVCFAGSARARIFRDTVVDRQHPTTPAVLIVQFRLRAVHSRTHPVLQKLSVLTTPLFAGSPGFISKLWLADDESGVFRGIYEWDGPQRAESYAETLRWMVQPMAAPGTFDYHVIEGEDRAKLVAEAECLATDPPPDLTATWRPT